MVDAAGKFSSTPTRPRTSPASRFASDVTVKRQQGVTAVIGHLAAGLDTCPLCGTKAGPEQRARFGRNIFHISVNDESGVLCAALLERGFHEKTAFSSPPLNRHFDSVLRSACDCRVRAGLYVLGRFQRLRRCPSEI